MKTQSSSKTLDKDAKSHSKKYQGLLHNSSLCRTIRYHLKRKSTSLLFFSVIPTYLPSLLGNRDNYDSFFRQLTL